MPAVFELLSDLGTTDATALAGATRIDRHEQTTGTLSLVRQLGEKTAPTGIVHSLGQHSTGQAFDIQIFDGNQAKVLHQPMRQFVVEVLTLVANVRVSGLKLPHGPAATVTAFLAPRHFALGAPEPLLSRPVLARVGDDRAVRQDREALQTHVDTDSQQRSGQRLGFNFDAEADVPLACFALERDGLDLSVHRPMQFDLEDTHALNPELA